MTISTYYAPLFLDLPKGSCSHLPGELHTGKREIPKSLGIMGCWF